MKSYQIIFNLYSMSYFFKKIVLIWTCWGPLHWSPGKKLRNQAGKIESHVTYVICCRRRERLEQIRKLFLMCYHQSVGHNIKDVSGSVFGKFASKIYHQKSWFFVHSITTEDTALKVILCFKFFSWPLQFVNLLVVICFLCCVKKF